MIPNSGMKRNIQLDVLRGVAILLVFGRHLELPRAGGIVGGFAELWYRIGWLGVDLFFVLSGFLIGGLLVTELQQHGRIDITRFLIRRGLKIYPAYFVFIGYLIAMPVAKGFLRGADPFEILAVEWARYWPNLLFLQNYIGTNPAGHTWTLAVEEHFYLMLPFLLSALAAIRCSRKVVILCAISSLVFLALRCLSVWMADPFSVKMSATHLRLDALLFGVGLRGVAQYYPQRFAAARRWRVALLAAGILCWSPNVFPEFLGTVFIRTIGLTATYLGSAAFLLAAFHTHASDFGPWRWCVAPVAAAVSWVGFYSYTVYLWHVTAMGILERELGGRLLAWTGGTGQLSWLVCAVTVSAGAVLAGVLASKVVEWPVLRFRDRVFPSRSKAISFSRPSESAGLTTTNPGSVAQVQSILSPAGDNFLKAQR